MADSHIYDVSIIGGGPAGLSAALVLGRCCKSVIIFDKGEPRNARAEKMHAFLSRDGIAPSEFLQIAREQIRIYDSVHFRTEEVVDAKRSNGKFTVRLETNELVFSRNLILATGVVDDLPKIPGIDQFYGKSVHHCPYCDGWEYRNKAVAVTGNGDKAVGLALELTGWTSAITLCTNGQFRPDEKQLRQLQALGIAVRCGAVTKLTGTDDGQIEQVHFAEGDPLIINAMFFCMPNHVRCDFAASLGCEFTSKGAIEVGDQESTPIEGLYCVGDVSSDPQYVIVAASEGAKAAIAINQKLLEENLKNAFKGI
jgi:thioredoxin reductase